MTKIESKFFKGESAEWEERFKVTKNFFTAERKKEALEVIEKNKKAVLLAAVAHLGEINLYSETDDSYKMGLAVNAVVADLLKIHFTRQQKAFVLLDRFDLVKELNLEPLVEIAVFELDFFKAGYEKAKQEVIQSIKKL